MIEQDSTRLRRILSAWDFLLRLQVLKTAARVLAKISNDERSAELLAQMADIGALIKAMRTHFALEEFLR